VTGNKCKRGEAFAVEEMTAPKRSVTSTVATAFADMPVVSVRTDGEIDKSRVFELMKYLKTVKADKRLKAGDILCANVLGTGVDLIITTDMGKDYEQNGIEH
jgi:CxxC motif-containing protein